MPRHEITRAEQALALVRHGPVRSDHVATALGVSHRNADAVLRRMQCKGVIRSRLTYQGGRWVREWFLDRGEPRPAIDAALAAWTATSRALGPTGTEVAAAIADARRARAHGGAR
ncbi:MAG: hypothetical protein HYU77_13700 [Betaproteobacteria bacterium]|nr:hypothetical protein [Betaproteobacteria bacterium]